MGLFNKLFGQQGKPTPADTTTQQQQAPCKTEQELLERYGGMAFDKQMDFGAIIGSNSWQVDIANGTISFGPTLVFRMQVLGTISYSSQTWLWAWANVQSGLPANMLQHALQLKQYGEENAIDFLRSDSFDFSKEALHLVGLIASGLLHAGAYYIADYGKGAMVVNIENGQFEKQKAGDHHRILTVFPQLISLFDMNHKTALTNYLLAKGYAVTESNDAVSGMNNDNIITAQFDEQSRLTKLNG